MQSDAPRSGSGRPEAAVHHVDDAASGLRAWIVLDRPGRRPALGGIRFRAYENDREALADARALARQMSWKCALAGLPAGGGKGVVRADLLQDRRRACALLGDFVESLDGAFRAAGDLGATAADLTVLASRTRHVVDPTRLDALGEASAAGLEAALEEVAHRLGRGLDRLRVLIQGVGDIGRSLARRLAGRGVELLVADPDPTALARVLAETAARPVPPQQALATPADVFAPCAMGGVLDVAGARTIPVRAIVGGANRVLATAAAGETLWRRGILYAPDFVVNAGAVIHGGLEMLRGRPGRADEIARIGVRLGEILDEATRRDVPPERVAEERAEALLAAEDGDVRG